MAVVSLSIFGSSLARGSKTKVARAIRVAIAKRRIVSIGYFIKILSYEDVGDACLEHFLHQPMSATPFFPFGRH